MSLNKLQVQVSLVLACYNEAEHIEESVPEILKVLDAARWSYEIIFVDDVSHDNTRELILKLINQHPNHQMSYIFHERNTGRGGAVSDGFRAAVGEVVGFIDIDLEVHARYIPACLLSLQDGADVCIAQRVYRIQPQRLLRHLMSTAYASLSRLILRLPYNDTETGFKFLRREVALDVLQHVNSQEWFWDTEFMYHVHCLGYKVVELPCLFTRRLDKTSTVKPIVDSLTYLRSLTKFAIKIRSQEDEQDGRQLVNRALED